MPENDFLNPYKKIAAAEELLQHNHLVELYCQLYRKKYKAEPIFFSGSAHLSQLKAFQKAVGDKAHGMLSFFFSMRDEWFEKQHYSMDCLMKNLNRINTAYLRAIGGMQAAASGSCEIDFHCDSCWAPFKLRVKSSYDFDRITRCPVCEGENRPFKKVSKEERQEAIRRLGLAFPLMP